MVNDCSSGLMIAWFRKRFNADVVIEARLEQPADRFSVTVLFGHSGCGKTTILRCLAGLERPEQGEIRFLGETWFAEPGGVFRSPQQRGIGYLFQDYALFPHLTVAENVAFGLHHLPRGERRLEVGRMLDLFGLTALDGRRPHEISGGQQQRVALARVLARRPRLLLLDEPLSALDTPTREQIRQDLRHRLAEFGIPVVLVTHDRIEAISLADQIIVLDGGKIRQRGTVHEIFTQPTDLTVARMVGMETVEHARVVAIQEGLATVRIGSVELLAIPPATPSKEVYACIRAEEVILQKRSEGQSSARNQIRASVVSLVSEGPLIRVALDCGFRLTALVTRPAAEELKLQPGDLVTALIKAPSIHLIPRD